jgi:transcriptional accessory protein Tex/SPT6
MVGHYLSNNSRLIEYLNSLAERPTLNVSLINKTTKIIQKFQKYDYQRDINVHNLSPVDILNLICYEELNFIKLEFNCTKIRNSAYKLLTEELFPLSSHEFLHDCFAYMWSFYFETQLKCFYRYELKVKAKSLLKKDFEMRLKPILLREPILKKTILGIEPIGNYNYFCFGLYNNDVNKYLLNIFSINFSLDATSMHIQEVFVKKVFNML